MILFTYSACEECFYKQNIFLNTRDKFDDSASLGESGVNVQQVITRRPMRAELHRCTAECRGGTRSGGASRQCARTEHRPGTLAGARRGACCPKRLLPLVFASHSWSSPKHQAARTSESPRRLSAAPIPHPLVSPLSLSDSSLSDSIGAGT